MPLSQELLHVGVCAGCTGLPNKSLPSSSAPPFLRQVKELQSEELSRPRRGSVIFCFQHLAGDAPLLAAALASGAIFLAFEAVAGRRHSGDAEGPATVTGRGHSEGPVEGLVEGPAGRGGGGAGAGGAAPEVIEGAGDEGGCSRPILSPMSRLAGALAVQTGAWLLTRPAGGW